MKKSQISRRAAIQSLAAITAGLCLKPASIFGAQSVQDTVRFAVIGDWGTDSGDTAGIGEHIAVWKATDNWNNVSYCSVSITVSDREGSGIGRDDR